MSRSSDFLITEPISERELCERYARWVLVLTGGDRKATALRLGVALPTLTRRLGFEGEGSPAVAGCRRGRPPRRGPAEGSGRPAKKKFDLGDRPEIPPHYSFKELLT